MTESPPHRPDDQPHEKPEPVSSIRGLGPAMENAFAAAGIPDAPSLRALGADAAYARLLENGARPHFIGYYALVMALQGRPWNDCKGAEKEALRKTFDALKTRAAAPSTGGDGLPGELARFLRDTGITPRKR
ncbi:TfoX/Sxy family protein [Cognatishimia sp. F0-27]|uniref:TfoX/Sxy family protein n=1 Tax=Cognatishimia sp. F0-27 TaxID=2816855 RepID=UPI001D0C83E5|nr:TfoX/Sxy family protein [Cognatishimia sp. F0-27]MCC1493430.1 TfoX/Sxy family protein [Cognatishimia sp. F0-27]